MRRRQSRHGTLLLHRRPASPPRLHAPSTSTPPSALLAQVPPARLQRPSAHHRREPAVTPIRISVLYRLDCGRPRLGGRRNRRRQVSLLLCPPGGAVRGRQRQQLPPPLLQRRLARRSLLRPGALGGGLGRCRSGRLCFGTAAVGRNGRGLRLACRIVRCVRVGARGFGALPSRFAALASF